MNQHQNDDIQPVRMETSRAITVAGLKERYQEAGSAGIPAQWQRLSAVLGNLEQQVGEATYGVCHNFSEGGAFDYLCGVEVKSTLGLPEDWQQLTLPAEQTYAVFQHEGHTSMIRHTCETIFSRWLPNSGYQSSQAPFFERYGPEFDGRTGEGGLEIWVPVQVQ